MNRIGLVADAGGTNIRFALVDIDRTEPGLIAPAKFESRSFSRMEDAARAYIDPQRLEMPISAAVIAVAGPVSENAISMTNLGWHFAGAELEQGLGIGSARLINDFEAIARAIPWLDRDDLRLIGSAPAHRPQERETVAIVGPGTGLGVGGYIHTQDYLVPLTGEGGHADFAPADDTETEILKILRRRFGHVSAERLLSGPGLSNLHDALAAIEGRPATQSQAHAITAEALSDPDSFGAQTVSRFCALLGSFAGNVALVTGAREGVFIAGGIVPAIADLLEASKFRARFEAKGRFANYMKKIPTKLIVQEYAGLIGAAAALRLHARHGD
jgi:glucokinase